LVLLEAMFQALRAEHVKGPNAPVLKAYMAPTGASSPDGLDIIKKAVAGKVLYSSARPAFGGAFWAVNGNPRAFSL
jgi:hypothetical protein